jgi:hypothetical protein
VIGGVVGGVTGVLGVDDRPRFHSYVVEQRRPSYQYREDVRVGAILPDDGVTYYDVPPEYGVREHRYTVVNGRTVWLNHGHGASSRSSNNDRGRLRTALFDLVQWPKAKPGAHIGFVTNSTQNRLSLSRASEPCFAPPDASSSRKSRTPPHVTCVGYRTGRSDDMGT